MAGLRSLKRQWFHSKCQFELKICPVSENIIHIAWRIQLGRHEQGRLIHFFFDNLKTTLFVTTLLDLLKQLIPFHPILLCYYSLCEVLMRNYPKEFKINLKTTSVYCMQILYPRASRGPLHLIQWLNKKLHIITLVSFKLQTKWQQGDEVLLQSIMTLFEFYFNLWLYKSHVS